MRKGIIGIFVATLLIATAVLPVVGTINEKICPINDALLPPSAAWRKTFGGNEFDHFHSARQTSDGGYIACGLTEESDEYYAWLIKVDPNGNEEWRKVNYDLNGTELENLGMWVSACDVIEVSDGGFLVTGWSNFPYEYGGDTYWLPAGYFWKTDANGNTQWVKRFYDIKEELEIFKAYFFYNVIEVSDGFIGGGYNTETVTDSEVYFDNGTIMKTDFSGNMLWINEFDTTRYDYLSSVYQTSDGGYFLGGFVEGNEYQGNDALRIVKTNENGELDWEQIFDGPRFEYTFGKGFFETNDGGYIMNGVSNSYGHGGQDTWVIKTDKNGKEKWNKTYGYEKNDYCWGMCSADNDGFALGICLNWGSLFEDADISIIETDEEGNIEWISDFENEGHQETRSINPTNDGGYIVGGMTSTDFGDPECDAILYKINPFDNEQPTKPAITGGHKGKPDKEYTFTASSSDPDGQKIFYMWDWGDGNYSEWLDTTKATYSWATEDNFEIRVLVKDFYGYESEWSDPFAFSTPKSKTVNPIYWLFENFPILSQILKQFLKI
ncbi:MAG: hypothetical protein BV456_04325 [Thermoplasmata archaeon M8B2D]|nr:MAG: hypothetical protein BV456_04325 [Thermoplasmata archaeon M8B2D]